MTADKICDRCGSFAPFNTFCGAHVCEYCDAHVGLARCFCGWAASGGDGYRELLDCGEPIEEEDY